VKPKEKSTGDFVSAPVLEDTDLSPPEAAKSIPPPTIT
jgi:hypothetical protein